MADAGPGAPGGADQGSEKAESGLITVGEIVGAYGVKGWVKVKSDTQPENNILQYAPWWLKTRHGVRQVEVDQTKERPQGLVVHLSGLDDRDEAAALRGTQIAVQRDRLPQLDAGEYYWHQLIGLVVTSLWDGSEHVLGKVTSLLETGANDVLVVRGGPAGLDQRERLVPYLPGDVVKNVDLAQGTMLVEWDPEF